VVLPPFYIVVLSKSVFFGVGFRKSRKIY